MRLVSPPTIRPAAAVVMLLASITGIEACTPGLDWRETRPAPATLGALRGLTLLMPCKPSVQQRTLSLAETPVQMTMCSCTAAGQTWGLAFADVGDPGKLGPALQQLAAAAAANVNATEPQPLALTVPGATPHPSSQRVPWQGALPGGQATWMQIAVFARGTWVIQATVLTPQAPGEAAQIFMESIRFGP